MCVTAYSVANVAGYGLMAYCLCVKLQVSTGFSGNVTGDKAKGLRG